MEDTDESPKREVEGFYKVVQVQDSAWVIYRSKSHLGRTFFFNPETGQSVWNLSELELKKAKPQLGSYPTGEPTGSPMAETEHSRLTADAETGSQNINPGRIVNNQYVGQQYGYPVPFYAAPPPQPTQYQGFQSITPLPQAAPQLPFPQAPFPQAPFPQTPFPQTPFPQTPFPQTPFQMLPPQLAAPMDIDPAMENIRRMFLVQRTTKSMSDRFTDLKDNDAPPVLRSNIRLQVNPTPECSTSKFRTGIAVSDNQLFSTLQGIEDPVRDNAKDYFKSQGIATRRTSLSSEINIPTVEEDIPSSLEVGDNIVLDQRGPNYDVLNRTNFGPRKTKATSTCDLRRKILNKRREREMIQHTASNYDRTMENMQKLNVDESSVNSSPNCSDEIIMEDKIPTMENSKVIEEHDRKWIAENSYNIGTRAVLDVTELKKNATCFNGQYWYIVADTNVYILNSVFLQVLVDSDEDCRLLLVQEVWAELKSTAVSARDPATEGLARSAIRMIERLMDAGKAVNEQNVIRRPIYLDCPNIDDQILNCCIRLMQKNYRAMFLTNDKLLKLKALSTSINTFTIKELQEFLTLYKRQATDDDVETPIVITIKNSWSNDQLAGPGTMEHTEVENEDCTSHNNEFDEHNEYETVDDVHNEPEVYDNKSLPSKPLHDSDVIIEAIVPNQMAITRDNAPATQSTIIGRDLQTSATVTASGKIPTHTNKKRVIRLKRGLTSHASGAANPTSPIVTKRPFGKWRRRSNASGSIDSVSNIVDKPTVVQSNKIDTHAVTTVNPLKSDGVNTRDLDRARIVDMKTHKDVEKLPGFHENMPDSLMKDASNNHTNTRDMWTTKSTDFYANKFDTHAVQSEKRSEIRAKIPDPLKLTTDVSNNRTAIVANSTASTVNKPDGQVVKPTTKLRLNNHIEKLTGINVEPTNTLVTRSITRQADYAVTIPVNKPDTQAIKSTNKPVTLRIPITVQANGPVPIRANKPDIETMKLLNKPARTTIPTNNKPPSIPTNKPDTYVTRPINVSVTQANNATIPIKNLDSQVMKSPIKPDTDRVVRTIINTNNKPADIPTHKQNTNIRSPTTTQADIAVSIPVNKLNMEAMKSPNKLAIVRNIRPTIPAKTSAKSGTKCTDTSTKAPVDNKTLNLLNNVRDEIAISSDNLMTEQNAKCSQTASDSLASESCVRKSRLNVARINTNNKSADIPTHKPNTNIRSPTTTQADIAVSIPVNKLNMEAMKSPNKLATVRNIRPTIPAKTSAKSGTKCTDTSTKAPVDNKTLNLLNNVRDKIAILSDNLMTEQNAKCSQSASESLTSESSVRKPRLNVARTKHDTVVPESPEAESDIISNSDAVSVHSEHLSRYLTKTGMTKDGAVSTYSAEMGSSNKHEVPCPIMKENLKLRCDEFMSLFFQIMEEVLTQVLQHDTVFSKVEITPPWTLHEATECLEVIYPEGSEIGYAAHMLSDTLYDKIEDGIGNIKPVIKPAEYMDMFKYGVLLVWEIAKDKNLRSCDEIQSAIQRLSKLLNEIKQPRSTASLSDSFNDMSFISNNEDGISGSNLPDAGSCPQPSSTISARASTNFASGLQEQEKKQPTDFLKKLNLQRRENELRVSQKIASKTADSMSEKTEKVSISPPKKTKNCSDKKESTKSATTGPTITRQFILDPEFEKKLKRTANMNLEFDDENDDEPVATEHDNDVINKQLVPPQTSTPDQLRLNSVTGSEPKNTDNIPMVQFHFSKYTEFQKRLKANNDLDLEIKMDEDEMLMDAEDDNYEEDNYYNNGESNDGNHYDNQNFDECHEENDNGILSEYNNNNDVTVIQIFLKEVKDTLLKVYSICEETITEIGAAEKMSATRKYELQDLIDEALTRIKDLVPELNRILDREINGPKNDIKIKRGNSCFGNMEYSSFVDKILSQATQLLDALNDTKDVLNTTPSVDP